MKPARPRRTRRAAVLPSAILRRRLGLLAAVACVPLGGCARTAVRASGSGGPPTDPPGPVAVVSGTRITKGDLADLLYARFREPWLEAVDQLVDERILALERTRLAVSVPPAVLDAAVEAEVAARTKQLHARFGEEADLAASVQAYYGLDLARWRREVLRPRLETHLLLQRVVRLSSRGREQVLARLIVSKDAERARAIRAKVERGADFSLLAVQESEDATKAVGGVLPPLGRGDLPIPSLEAALFGAAPGTLVGPLEITTAQGREWHVYKIVERLPPWPGDAAALRDLVEADLAKSPVTKPEYDRWSTAARRRHGVAVFAPDGSVLRLDGSGR